MKKGKTRRKKEINLLMMQGKKEIFSIHSTNIY